jgi:hypothetical protein
MRVTTESLWCSSNRAAMVLGDDLRVPPRTTTSTNYGIHDRRSSALSPNRTLSPNGTYLQQRDAVVGQSGRAVGDSGHSTNH